MSKQQAVQCPCCGSIFQHGGDAQCRYIGRAFFWAPPTRCFRTAQYGGYCSLHVPMEAFKREWLAKADKGQRKRKVGK